MAHEGPPINWDAFYDAGADGQLVALLVKLPRARWGERDKYGDTLLHYACRGPNVAAVVALVQSRLVDVSAPDERGRTPAHYAATRVQPCAMEVLCIAGADLRACNHRGCSPIDLALFRISKDGGETARVLVANGVRLSTVHKACRHRITPELCEFERGVLRCRAAVVAMLRVKQASGQLVRWDRFLLLELAVCIWSTRYDKGWQTATQ